MSCGFDLLVLSQFGITWTLLGSSQYGQFVTGDYWVVGPVTVVSIAPESKPDLAEQIVEAMDATAGTFRLTFNGQITGNIPFDVSADGLKSLLEQLPNIDNVRVVKTWQGHSQWSVQFVSYQGPLTLMALDRGSLNRGRIGCFPRVKNGSMLNPVAIYDGLQGYEAATNVLGYKSSLNVAESVSASSPLVLPAGSSLVSMISHTEPYLRPSMRSAAVLTVLAAPPPAGSFRPPWAGTNKTLHNVSSLQPSLLLNLAPAASAPALAEVERWFERPWIEHVENWIGEAINATENFDFYGREFASRVGDATLLLQCNHIADKSTLLRRVVQKGIDYYGLVGAGGNRLWPHSGGYCTGRKWLILFAGIMLDNAGMKSIGTQDVAFGEEWQTFYVEETSPNVYNYGYGGYNASHVGMPEWGGSHRLFPQDDNVVWTANSYRFQGAGNAWSGQILAARMMGAKALWNYNALFDYMDRYMGIMTVPPWQADQRAWHRFMGTMWDLYRSSY